MSRSLDVYFAGLTGPERSGGDMAVSYTLLVNGKIHSTSAKYVPANPDGSWHTATYLALAYAVQSCQRRLGGAPQLLTFFTDNKMVVNQMTGRWRAKDGHYLGARDEALRELNKIHNTRGIPFLWVPNNKNRAVKICRNLFQSFGVREWSWKEEQEKQKLSNPEALVTPW